MLAFLFEFYEIVVGLGLDVKLLSFDLEFRQVLDELIFMLEALEIEYFLEVDFFIDIFSSFYVVLFDSEEV